MVSTVGSRVDTYSHVVRAVMQWPFQSHTPEEIKKLQDDDPAIGPVLQAVGSGNYPSEDVVKSWSLKYGAYCNSQSALCVRWGVAEKTLKWRDHSPSASTAFDAAGRCAWEIAR